LAFEKTDGIVLMENKSPISIGYTLKEKIQVSIILFEKVIKWKRFLFEYQNTSPELSNGDVFWM